MKTIRKIILYAAALVLCLTTACSGAGSGESSAAAGVSSGSVPVQHAAGDSYAWDGSSDCAITLEGGSASISGSGASVSGSTVTVASAGSYLVTGKLDDGQILVEAGKEDTVRLILSGADITCTDSAPIFVSSAGSVLLTLADGTENRLTDGYAGYAYDGSDPSAVVYSEADLVLCGSGTLSVTAWRNNGIQCKDSLTVTGGSVSIVSANDGLKGKDSIDIGDAELTVTAGGDGIQSNNDTDAGMGWIAIRGGSFAIEAGADGIQAESALTIDGGSFAIIAGGGSETILSDDASAKALKTAGTLTVNGGSFVIDSADDALHSDGDATVTGGSFTVATGSDGFHAENVLTVGGGEITVSKCNEGFEGAGVIISGGTHSITSDDDGINAASDTYPVTGITVSGGVTYVNAEGDGIDSNGDVAMTGGTLTVDGPTGSDNSALDYDGSFNITGGELIAAGSAGMTQNVSSAENLCAVLIGTGSQSAGTAFTIKDASGSVVLSHTPAKDYQCVAVASAKLMQGESYTVFCGETQVAEFTLSAAVSRAGSVSGGVGGFGGMGHGDRPPFGGEMQPPADGGFSRPEPPDGGTIPPDAPSGSSAQSA